MLRELSDAEIRFVLVGGLAVNAWGYLRTTQDVDVVPDPSAANLAKLDTVLRGLDGKVEVGGRLLAGSAISTFHVLQGLPQIPPFAVLDEKATAVDMDGLVVRVCSLEHLIEMKRASNRPRDLDDLEALRAANSE
ncbi:MAG: DUF6036 family nucleotidyltransferase [Solirubrobacterales bacterium]